MPNSPQSAESTSRTNEPASLSSQAIAVERLMYQPVFLELTGTNAESSSGRFARWEVRMGMEGWPVDSGTRISEELTISSLEALDEKGAPLNIYLEPVKPPNWMEATQAAKFRDGQGTPRRLWESQVPSSVSYFELDFSIEQLPRYFSTIRGIIHGSMVREERIVAADYGATSVDLGLGVNATIEYDAKGDPRLGRGSIGPVISVVRPSRTSPPYLVEVQALSKTSDVLASFSARTEQEVPNGFKTVYHNGRPFNEMQPPATWRFVVADKFEDFALPIELKNVPGASFRTVHVSESESSDRRR